MMFFIDKWSLNLICSIWLSLISWGAIGQNTITIYALPGQGSDHRIFDSLTLPQGYRLQVLNYGTPKRGANMQTFAQTLLHQIDTNQAFILLGVSLGGMLCAELAEVSKPQKTILISSAKNSTELPLRYKIQRKLPLYRLLPGCILKASAQGLQPIVEPDRNCQKATFKAMLKAKSALYFRRSVPLIITWNRTTNRAAILQIHGDLDHTLPVHHLKKPTRTVPCGSHMMTLTRGREVSQLLAELLVL
jgi:pimeloyl-ACP methyl ester carboxylesterase